ncbi:transglutaminase-like putative cysteine protease [Natronocella acetinitrilica]|uniref:Transglutaminase-like putative cysteine protease n=1 Tax=Natronocella acetinitrilica TaxID=414046 RepID=A0AAE3G300_9GAMM|nr:transglutaminase-like putative cysteine protease [Natronocella acetinitrilica]
MKYRVTHRTDYVYSAPVALGYNEAHLTPRGDLGRQRVLSHRVEVDPPPAYTSRRLDFFGNEIFYFTLQRPHSRLTVTAVSEVERFGDEPELYLASGMSWEEVVAATAADPSPEGLDARAYLLDSPLIEPSPDVVAYAAESFKPGRGFSQAVGDFIQRIHREFAFDPAATNVSTPVSKVFEARRGVCQDFAHLAITGLRGLGVAARYVSGYLETLPPPGQAKLVGSDASHAWVAVFEPGGGWREYDPTNDITPSQQHIVTAIGRDYTDISPIRGVVFGGGGTQKTKVAVDVERI